MSAQDTIAQLQQWIAQSDNIVFFGGAGVSTESGIKDFRSVDGLYHEKYAEDPETILSHSYFTRRPRDFFTFYRDKMLCPDARPNAAHRKLAQLEQAGKLKAVITQNIDGLHQMAGSRKVLELQSSDLPRCSCGGLIKPDVVLYEEGLDETTMYQAVNYIRNADLLIIGGTSLVVYPAAGLINYYRGNKLVLINLQSTPYDRYADLVIHEKIGQVMDQIWL